MSISDPRPGQPPAGVPWSTGTGGGADSRPAWDPARAQGVLPVPVPNALPVPHAAPVPNAPPAAHPYGLVKVGESMDLVGRVPYGEGVVRRVARAFMRGFTSTGRARELQEALAGVQAPITTGRRIAVTSVRGGAGKTAVCALVGSVFAARRPEPVLAVDAAMETGSLAWRLGTQAGTEPGTLAALAPALLTASGQDLASVARLLPRTACGLWVVPGGPGGQPHLARDVTRALSRLFAVAVLDCDTGMSAPVTTAVLTDAHAVIVVAPATPDGVRTTAAALSRVVPSALRRVVVALNTTDPQGGAALREGRAQAAFTRLGLPVVVLPYDRHVAAGATIDPGRLAAPTRDAACRLAAWSLGRAQHL